MITIKDIYECFMDCYNYEVSLLNEYEDRTYFGVKEFSPMGNIDYYVLYAIDNDIYNEYGTIIYNKQEV